MINFNFVVAGLEAKPSESCPLLFCVADAGIERTPFEREGRAMVTRGAGAIEVMVAGPLMSWCRQDCFDLLFRHRICLSS